MATSTVTVSLLLMSAILSVAVCDVINTPTLLNMTVADGNGTACILLQAQLMISPTPQAPSPTTSDLPAPLSITPAARVSGNCSASPSSQTLHISEHGVDLTLTFSKSPTDQVSVTGIEVSYDKLGLSGKVKQSNFLPTSVGGVYMCNANTTLFNDDVTVTVAHFRYTAFNSNNLTSLTLTSDTTISGCRADLHVNSDLPVAVGIALVAMVTLMSLAYVMMSRRMRGREAEYSQDFS